MAYSYELTDSVKKDIDNALNYITNEICNRKAARNLMLEIEKSIKNICEYPMLYPNCNYFYINDESFRHSIINNYILVYKILSDRIIFLSFRYSKQNNIL